MVEKSKTEGALIEWWSEILRSETYEKSPEFAKWMDKRCYSDESLQSSVRRTWEALLKERGRLQ